MNKPPKAVAAAAVAAALAAAGLVSAAFATTYPSEGAEDFAWLAGLKGTWTLDGKWANGSPLRARQTVEPMLAGRFVAVSTWSASGDAAETERDHVVIGLDKDARLTQWVYTPDGTARQTAATPTPDRTVQFDWTKTDAKGKATELRQVFTPIDADHYGWRMMMHIKDEWHTLFEGTWRRKSE